MSLQQATKGYDASDEIEDQTQISFQDTMWLRCFPLRLETVLDYFALSPFYSRSCNNEQCRMQGLDPNIALKNMTGVEYVTEESMPNLSSTDRGTNVEPQNLFIIKKLYRKSRTQVEVRGVYYILEGVVYQAPSAFSLITSRLQKSAFMLEEAFSTLEKLPKRNLDGSYDWSWNVEAKRSLQESLNHVDERAASNLKAGMNNVLLQMINKYTSTEEGKTPSELMSNSGTVDMDDVQ